MDSHLGGFLSGVHGDEATYFPQLWSWLVDGPLQIRSVLDVGCGEGHSLKYFRDELGCRVRGIDGVPQEDYDIEVWDCTKGAWSSQERFDLIWTCEFVEHVEEKYAHNLVPLLYQSDLLLMTHAFPGQPGYHHVNCREPEYWKGFVTSTGLLHDVGYTAITRQIAMQNQHPLNHYGRAGLVFRRD